MDNKLNTTLTTKVIMGVSGVICSIWKYARCNVRRKVHDFDYHITDLRSQYPNMLSYKMKVGALPFFCKTVEVDDEFEKVSSVKIGDCNIRYCFDKLVKANTVRAEVSPLFDTRLEELNQLLRNTMVRHNKPSSLKVVEDNQQRKESNVVKFNR